ncbi:hypothetical protein [Streptomyces sp. NBC_00582]|uniref:hypothetical protein n=1 Tax=Streptomyces sp. NBC_00582 TaxID=2975783 RepID=UPI002E7FDFF4|nr:hypothetical protein [Streptomyces sp. NBC_00582]WUB63881.1 hypothetical protein OG852_27545 [Streptomyces sp. NBC_00582]
MGGVVKQVTFTKSTAARTDGQDVEVMRVVGSAPALMDGSTKPVINNQSGNFADLAAVTVAYNALLAALRTRGVIGGS